jgi:hypothetical protein
MLTSVENSAESSRQRVFQEWNLLTPEIMALRICISGATFVDIAHRRIWLLTPRGI